MRRALSIRASRSAGMSRRWLPMRCRNRPSLVWCTSNCDGGTSTIRHSTGAPSAPGRYSQFRAGTIMGTQLTVAALMTNCSRRSRLSGSIPTGVRSVSRTPITTIPPCVFAMLTNTSVSRAPARDSSHAKPTRLPAEYHLLQLELGILAGPNRSDEGVGVKHGSRLHVRSVRRMASLMLMLPFSFTGRYLLIEPPSASLRWAGPCFSLAFRCIRPTC